MDLFSCEIRTNVGFSGNALEPDRRSTLELLSNRQGVEAPLLVPNMDDPVSILVSMTSEEPQAMQPRPVRIVEAHPSQRSTLELLSNRLGMESQPLEPAVANQRSVHFSMVPEEPRDLPPRPIRVFEDHTDHESNRADTPPPTYEEATGLCWQKGL